MFLNSLVEPNDIVMLTSVRLLLSQVLLSTQNLLYRSALALVCRALFGTLPFGTRTWYQNQSNIYSILIVVSLPVYPMLFSKLNINVFVNNLTVRIKGNLYIFVVYMRIYEYLL